MKNGKLSEGVFSVTYYEKMRRFDRSSHFRDYKSVAVFVDVPTDNPRPGMKDIVADFRWRRNHNSPMPAKDVKALVAPVLKSLGYGEPKHVFYDKHAGCSSCPCSPGYTVRLDNHYRAVDKTSIYLTHRDIAKAEMADKEAVADTEDYNKFVASAFGM